MKRIIALAGVTLALLAAASPADARHKPKPTRKPAAAKAIRTATVPAWTPVAHATYPAVGTYDVSTAPTLGGYVGLQPNTDTKAEVTFRWYDDAAGQEILGVQGFPVSGLIPSLAQIQWPNLGPYLRVSVDCMRAGQPCPETVPFAMRLRGSIAPAGPQLPGDTILVTERDRTIAGNSSTAVYPADYCSNGCPLQVFLDAPAGVTVTLWAADLTWLLSKGGRYGPGSSSSLAPRGTFWFVISNTNATAATYSLTVTPDVSR